jgi:hypothetical protein
VSLGYARAVTARSMVGEGNVVLAEHRMSATLPNGRPYVNDYCFAYEVADGRVTVIREYMDTRGGWLQVFGGDPPDLLLVNHTNPEGAVESRSAIVGFY